MPIPNCEEDGLIKVRLHKGVWIYLRNERFAFSLNDIDKEEGTPEADPEEEPIRWQSKDSCEQAQKEIDRLLLCKTKASQVMNLPVYTSAGKATKIVGVHGRLLHALIKPKPDDDSAQLFPVVKWVGKAIGERLRLEKELTRLTTALELVQIEHIGMNENGNRMYSAHDVDDVTVAGKTLQKRYKDQTSLAEKLGGVDEAVAAVEKEIDSKRMTRRLRY